MFREPTDQQQNVFVLEDGTGSCLTWTKSWVVSEHAICLGNISGNVLFFESWDSTTDKTEFLSRISKAQSLLFLSLKIEQSEELGPSFLGRISDIHMQRFIIYANLTNRPKNCWDWSDSKLSTIVFFPIYIGGDPSTQQWESKLYCFCHLLLNPTIGLFQPQHGHCPVQVHGQSGGTVQQQEQRRRHSLLWGGVSHGPLYHPWNEVGYWGM